MNIEGKIMIHYWIRKEDLQNQKIIDEALISEGVSFVKVKEVRGAVFYHKEIVCPVPKKKLQTA